MENMDVTNLNYFHERSESIKEITGALLKFDKNAPRIKKDADNPFFKSKYADLSNIMDEIRGPLSDVGIVISQSPFARGNEVSVKTKLLHESGEYIASGVSTTVKDPGPQSVGSAITYLRRYGVLAELGLSPGEDDDGNAASQVTPIIPEGCFDPSKPDVVAKLETKLTTLKVDKKHWPMISVAMVGKPSLELQFVVDSVLKQAAV